MLSRRYLPAQLLQLLGHRRLLALIHRRGRLALATRCRRGLQRSTQTGAGSVSTA